MTEVFWGSLLAGAVFTWWLLSVRKMRDGVRKMESRFPGYVSREEGEE